MFQPNKQIVKKKITMNPKDEDRIMIDVSRGLLGIYENIELKKVNEQN